MYRLRKEKQCLCVVNTRRQALKLARSIPGSIYISTFLPPAQRKRILQDVKGRLDSKQSCCVISTQVIECGTDIDFEVVYRLYAPLDRMKQAGGRANRNGRRDGGTVYLVDVYTEGFDFMLEGEYKTGTDLTRIALQSNRSLNDPATYQWYFRMLVNLSSVDGKQIVAMEKAVDLEGIASAMKLIEDNETPVLLPGYDDESRKRVSELIEELQNAPTLSRNLIKSLSPYTVSLKAKELARAKAQGWVRDIRELNVWNTSVDPVYGIAPLFS